MTEDQMSVDIITVLIDEKILTDEINRLSKILPPDELDSGKRAFIDALVRELELGKKGRHDYEIAAHPEGWHSSNRYWFEIYGMVHQLIYHAWHSKSSVEAERSANILFEFTTACLSAGFVVNHGLNEFGFKNSTIIGPANARRLRTLYAQINFESLRPVFEEHCWQDNDLDSYERITSIDDLKRFVGFFDTFLEEAIRKNKILYMFAA